MRGLEWFWENWKGLYEKSGRGIFLLWMVMMMLMMMMIRGRRERDWMWPWTEMRKRKTKGVVGEKRVLCLDLGRRRDFSSPFKKKICLKSRMWESTRSYGDFHRVKLKRLLLISGRGVRRAFIF